MKCTVALAFFLLQVLVRKGDAVFGNIIGGGGGVINGGVPINGGDPNSFSLTNILECADDHGGRLNVPLVPPAGDGADFQYWLPQQTESPFPENLRWVSSNFDVLSQLVSELQDVDMTVQSLRETDMREDQLLNDAVCEGGVSNETDLNDDPNYIVFSEILAQAERANITLTRDPTTGPLVVFTALRCIPIHRWTDIGITFLPRFLAAGRCFDRFCSTPSGPNQRCRPDVRFESNFRRVPALRWDCCWQLEDSEDADPQNPFNFDCGWRKVNVPILCDCDCSCPRV